MQAIWHAVLTCRNILNLEVSLHVLHVKIHPKVYYSCTFNTLFEELCMKFMEQIMQIGLIFKRKHHFVLIDVSTSKKLTLYQIAIRLHWVWEICSSNVQNRVENLTFKFVPNWLVEHTKAAIIAIWLGKSFLPLLIYSQVASLSRASSLRKRSVIQDNGVSNLHSNKVFELFSFLNMFKLMVLITGRNQESVWL
jgi:hypothetical protein